MLSRSSTAEAQCSSSTVFASSIFLSSTALLEKSLGDVFEPHSKTGFYFKTPFAISLSADVFSSEDADKKLFFFETGKFRTAVLPVSPFVLWSAA